MESQLLVDQLLVDAWHKFANSASEVIMLWHNRNSRLQENLFIYTDYRKIYLYNLHSKLSANFQRRPFIFK